MNVTLDPKDQRLLEARARECGKDPGELLRELVHQVLANGSSHANETTGSKAVPPELSLVGLAGIGKGLWEREDAQEHVRKLRDEW